MLAPLLAVYAAFTEAIAGIPDAKAQELHRLSGRVPQFVAQARAAGADDAQVARGLEDGLHELPQLLAGVDAQWRWAVSRALHEAIAREYPAFADQQLQRVRAILDAGEIASDAELHFVRHRIAVLEGDAQLSPELQPLYALVREYR